MASATVTVSTLDELLQFISSTVRSRFSQTGRSTNGTILARDIRGRFPGFHFGQVGLSRLGDAVSLAESGGLVVRNRDVSHLELLPPGATFRKAVSVAIKQSHAPIHIRPDVWRAFVFVAPGQASYFDRATGKVVEGGALGANPDPAQFIAIPQIPVRQQQDWMEEFAASSVQDRAQEAPIRDPYCFIKFPAWLRGLDASLEQDWKAFRVRRVLDLIREWAQEHNVAAESLFLAARPSLIPVTTVPTRTEEDDVRSAVIAALQELPVERWESICTLIHWLVRAHKAR